MPTAAAASSSIPRLINSEVLPLAQYNFGFNLQWQPVDEWYAMAGGSMGNAQAGNAPWTDFSSENWSLPGEIGYAPRDLFDLGPGVYRIQPFAAEVNGATGGGLCFDLQQQLGSDSPFGWFGRFGFGGEKVSDGASAQAGSGFVLQGPFKHLLVAADEQRSPRRRVRLEPAFLHDQDGLPRE